MFCFHKAQIFTLHAFCLQTLKQSPFSHLSFEESQNPLLNEWLDQFLSIELSASTLPPWQLPTLLKAFRGDINLLKSSLIQDLNSYLPVINYPSAEESLQKLSSYLKDFIQSPFYDFLKKDPDSFSTLFKSNVVKGALKENVTYARHSFLQACCSKEHLAPFAEMQVFLKTHHPSKLLKKAQENPPSHFESYIQLHTRLSSLQSSFYSSARIYTRLLKKLHQDFYHKLIPDTLTPDQLLIITKEALNNESFIKQVRGNYRVICIDEFQDTDPLQWHIFSHLFPLETHDYYLVGDPKQSIYGFRQADLYTFLKAKEALKQENYVELRVNYRSSPNLCRAFNRLFSDAFTHSLFKLPLQKTSLPFHEIKSPSSSIASPYPPLTVAFFTPEKGKSVTSTEQQQVLPFVWKEIKKLLDRGAALSDCAILVKDRFQASRVYDFFQSIEVPCGLLTAQKIHESPIYFALRELIQAILQPKDGKKIKQALLNECLMLTPERVQSLDTPSEMALYVELFYDCNQALEEGGIASMLRALRQCRWPPEGHTLEACIMKHPDKKTAYQDFLSLCDSLLKLNDNLPPSRLLKTWHQSLLAKSKKKKELGPTCSGIQILTMHASKGLEFEHVFPVGILLSSRSSSLTYFVNHPEYRLRKAKEKEDPSLSLFHEEQNAEKMRLLYVSFTRAKQSLFIPFIMADVIKGPLENLSIADLYLLNLLAPQTLAGASVQHPLDKTSIKKLWKSHFSEDLLELVFPNPQTTVPHFSHQPLHLQENFHSFSHESPPLPLSPLYSYTKLSKFLKGTIPKEETKVKGKVALQIELPKGAATGLVLHSILQNLPFQKLSQLREEKIQRQYITPHLLSTPLEGKEKSICSYLFPLKDLVFPSLEGGFTLPQLHPHACLTEGEFIFHQQDTHPYFVHGYFDLLFEKDQCYYLLDWKSDELYEESEGYNVKTLKKITKEKYWLQLLAYTEAVNKYLIPSGGAKSFGGFFYVYLRALPYGKGLVSFSPEELSPLSEYLAPLLPYG